MPRKKRTSTLPPARLALKFSLDFECVRPADKSPEEYVASVVCNVMNMLAGRAVTFLDTHSEVCGVDDRALRREFIQNGFVLSLTELLCRAWTGKEEDLPGFVKTMQGVFAETQEAEGRGRDHPHPNVEDIGHA